MKKSTYLVVAAATALVLTSPTAFAGSSKPDNGPKPGTTTPWGTVKQQVALDPALSTAVDVPATQSGYVVITEESSTLIEWDGTFYQTESQETTNLVSRDIVGESTVTVQKDIKGNGKGNQGDGTNKQVESAVVEAVVVVNTDTNAVVSVTPIEPIE